ncbi:MAG TPA: ComEC/Rec2 family competence protein [Patescibacteria group bacterium]|nr:ComEC/Rec2 family competence protein [Patescibacteria group bacterium]
MKYSLWFLLICLLLFRLLTTNLQKPVQDINENFISKSLENFFDTSIPGDKGEILSSIVLGTKNNLTYFLGNKIKNLGITFLTETSGIKITILAGFLMTIFINKIKRQKSAILIILIIWIYIFITGSQTSSIKSGLITTIAFIGLIFGRVTNTLKISLIVFLLMLIIWPFLILDLGFILSFTATFSIVLFNSKIKNSLKFIPEILKEDLSIALSTNLGIFPIIFFLFGNFNFLGAILSLLLVWTISPILILGLAGGLISFISPVLGKLILLPVIPLLSYFISILGL